MFSLPNIKSMNERAEEKAKEFKGMSEDELVTCDWCDKEVAKKSANIEEFHDSLSEGPKGHVVTCNECAEEGKPEDYETYFLCDNCGNLHITNYSWEIYRKDYHGETLCVPCYRKAVLREDANWLKIEEEIRFVSKFIESHAKHLSCIGSEYEMPEGVKSFRDTEEYEEHGYDFYSHMRHGSDPTNDEAACALAAFRFYGEVMFIVGEAGQFQVYLDVLVRTDSKREAALPEFSVEKEFHIKSAEPIPAGAFLDPVI